MIRFQKNKLNTNGVEFSLPENSYIYIESLQGPREDGLKILLKEKDCYINFMTSGMEYKSPLVSLMDVFMDDVNGETFSLGWFNSKDNGYTWITEPQMTKIGGLDCAHVKYETPHNFYYEIHFERVKGYDRQLEVLLTVPKEKGVELETVLNRESVKAFYNSFNLFED